MLLMLTQSRNDPLSSSPLQFLHEAAGSLGGLGLDQQVEMLRHEHPADEEETCLLPNLPQHLNKGASEAVAVKKLQTAVSIPYSWKLTTPSADTIILTYIVAFPAGASKNSVVFPERVTTITGTTIKGVPASGTTTDETVDVTI